MNNDSTYGTKEGQSYVLIFCNHIYNISEFPCNSKIQLCLLLPVSSGKHSKQTFNDLLNIVFYNEAICGERQCPLKTSHQFSPVNAFHRILLKQNYGTEKDLEIECKSLLGQEQSYMLILALSSSEKARLNISF